MERRRKTVHIPTGTHCPKSLSHSPLTLPLMTVNLLRLKRADSTASAPIMRATRERYAEFVADAAAVLVNRRAATVGELLT